MCILYSPSSAGKTSSRRWFYRGLLEESQIVLLGIRFTHLQYIQVLILVLQFRSLLSRARLFPLKAARLFYVDGAGIRCEGRNSPTSALRSRAVSLVTSFGSCSPIYEPNFLSRTVAIPLPGRCQRVTHAG